MSGSYWRYIFAALGILSLALLSYGTYELYEASRQHHPDYRYQPASKPRFVQVLPGKKVPEGYKPHCQNPQTKEDADLCAQWAAVEQVGESNRVAGLNLKLAIFSLWATAIATVLLVWNLVETRNASRRELRAYVFVKPKGLRQLKAKKPIIIDINMTNGGATPAYETKNVGAIIVAKPPLGVDVSEIFREPTAILEAGAAVLHREETKHSAISSSANLSARELTSLKNGKSAIYCFVEVVYRDIFNRNRITKVGYCLDPDEMKSFLAVGGGTRVLRWHVTDTHNDAT